MNQTLKTVLISLAVIITVVILLIGGLILGRNIFFNSSNWQGGMMNFSWSDHFNTQSFNPRLMMGNYRDGQSGDSDNWGYRGGMMSGYNGLFSNSLIDADPLSLEAAQEYIEIFLADFDEDNLEIGEIMIFSNHAYAEIIESDTGIGAMEVLVDPISGSVSLEFGPSMMWNTKYGMHSGFSGGMMGRNFMNWTSTDVDQPMQITEDEAVEIAQDYLDQNQTGLTADEHADTFYGYYTLHTYENEELAGMLSVNGYTGEVFIHSWHGDFIEMDTAH